jgi:DNA excision repair protein ERCC-2
MKEFGQQRGLCPYFFARHLIGLATVVVYNYQYLIDPKIAGLVSREIDKEAIIVFDEAHNIDNICIEALSVTLNQRTLNKAGSNLRKLRHVLENVEQSDAQRLQNEYQRLVEGLSVESQPESAPVSDQIQANPVLPLDVLKEAVPGNIRRAKHFIMFLQTVLQFFVSRLQGRAVVQETSVEFVHHLEKESRLKEFQTRALKFSYDRLQSLLKTLEITHLDEFVPLQMVTNFCTLVSTYQQGFVVLMEPYNDRAANISDPVLHLACLDASIAMRPVLEKFRSVVITSGTMSPIDLYPKLLNFTPTIIESLAMSTSSRCGICPMVAAKGNDQIEITSKFEKRNDAAVIANYGRLLVDLASVVPDGMVVFFTSYLYMESIISAWNDSGVLKEVLNHKLIFVETQDVVETSLALDSFKKACDCGRGAVFFSIARGKVAEGIDFDRHYGRCVILMGVPFQYTLSKKLRARLQFLKDTHNISESEFLSFDALRQASQCVGRVIRSKMDYGIMIFADAVRTNRVTMFILTEISAGRQVQEASAVGNPALRCSQHQLLY